MSEFKPDTLHPLYAKFSKGWSVNRDFIAGTSAVKAKKQTYLPPEAGMEDAGKYDSFLNLAKFLAATTRTVQALSGMITRKPCSFEGDENIPEEVITDIKENITVDRRSLADLIDEAVFESCSVSRSGLLCEYPETGENLTVAEMEALDPNGYLVLYKAEQIINWRTKLVNGRRKLNLVVLYAQEQEVDPENEFATKAVDVYYILDLVNVLADSESSQNSNRLEREVYRKRIAKRIESEKYDITTYFPRINGELLDYIPFYFDGDVDPEIPYINPLVALNWSHYLLSASFAWALKYVAMPTPYLAGNIDRNKIEVKNPNTGKKYIPMGPNAFHVFPPDTVVGHISYSGDGLQLTQEELKERKSEMAVLGARLLAADPKQVEAEETALIHRSGEHAALTRITNSVSEMFTQAIKTLLRWRGIEESSFKLKLNTDYTATNIDPQLLSSVFNAYIDDALPLKDWFEFLKRGEIISGSRTIKDFEKELKMQKKDKEPVTPITQQTIPDTSIDLQQDPISMQNVENQQDVAVQ